MATKINQGRILIIEDEQTLSSIIRDYLKIAGYICDEVADGALAIQKFHAFAPDLVILDLMLPNRDGLEICRELRSFSNLSIIMVTARVEEIDRVLGLESGADDYICKPFSPREVVARVNAALRRQNQFSNTINTGLVTNGVTCQASLDGLDLNLTQVEFRLLDTLSKNPGRVYSRNQLMDNLYSDNRIVTDRTVDSHIKNLRKKLGNKGEQWIHSVYGVGYRFEV